jgi:hypothetical protein
VCNSELGPGSGQASPSGAAAAASATRRPRSGAETSAPPGAASRRRTAPGSDILVLAAGLLALMTYVLPWAIGRLAVGSGSYPQPYRQAASFFADKTPQYVFGAAVILVIVCTITMLRRRRAWVTVAAVTVALLVTFLGYRSAQAMKLSFERDARLSYEHDAVPTSAVPTDCTLAPVRWSSGRGDQRYEWTALFTGGCSDVAVYRGWTRVMFWPAGPGRQFLALARYDPGILIAFTGPVGQYGDTITAVGNWNWRDPSWLTHICASTKYDEIIRVTFKGQTGNEVKAAPIQHDVTRYVAVECAGRNIYLDAETGHVIAAVRR